jgi:hypothetical protein
MSTEPLHITVIEPAPFAEVPRPGHLRLVPPLKDVTSQGVLALPLRPHVVPIPPVPPVESRLLVHADPARARLLGEPWDPEDDVDPHFGRRFTGRAELPEPMAWVARFAQASLEVIAGRRTPMQLMRWTNRSVYAQMTYRAGVIDGRVAIRRIRICEPADGVVEASVIAHFNDRAHAMALRFEGLDGRWLCTALTAQFSPRRPSC